MHTISRDAPCFYLSSVTKDRLPVFRKDEIKTLTSFARKVLISPQQLVVTSGPAYQCLMSLFLLNPTCGSRWIVQVLPISVENLRARLHLKYPSAAAEGIQKTNPNLFVGRT
ncbi:MAG TPA: hypothetical protein VN643_08855 [Pyrinomonadaceae bacterium]|nr:hypothetical protein [Pyrinomonadaceae bacterium]